MGRIGPDQRASERAEAKLVLSVLHAPKTIVEIDRALRSRRGVTRAAVVASLLEAGKIREIGYRGRFAVYVRTDAGSI